MDITQEVINQVHERLQYDDIFECPYHKDIPKTSAGILQVGLDGLISSYGKRPSLVIISWSAAEALMAESQRDFWTEHPQGFRGRYSQDLYEAGYVGDLDEGQIPVVASIHADSKYAILTVADNPLQIENETRSLTNPFPAEHNSILAFWGECVR